MDLANDLGNLVSRTTAMVGKVLRRRLPPCRPAGRTPDGDLITVITSGLRDRYEEDMERFAPQDALAEVFKVIQRANKYIDETAPWALAKDMEANGPRLAQRHVQPAGGHPHLRHPADPLHARRACDKLFAQIGACEGCRPGTPPPSGAPAGPPRSPRAKTSSPGWTWTRPWPSWRRPRGRQKGRPAPAVEVEPQLAEQVDFDTFCKSDFRVVKVKACEPVKKSNKLLSFTLDDGTGTDRQILSGIAAYYKPEELMGKSLVAIVNLPPGR